MARGRVFWTPERIDKIKQFLEEGRSYEEIARYFGKSETAIRLVVYRYKLRQARSIERTPEIDRRTGSTDIARRIAELLGEGSRQEDERGETDITEEKLRKWIKDPILFAEEVCKVDLQEYQREILDLLEKKKRVALVMGRGSGKTFTVALYALIKAIMTPRIRIVIVGPSLRQSKILFDTIINFIVKSGILANSLKKITRKNEYKIVLTNDSEIIAFPCTDRGQLLRGIRADIVILEEAAYIPDEVWSVVIPFVATSREGKIIAISTPKSTRDRFFQVVTGGEYAVLKYPTMVNKYVSEKTIGEFRKQMTEIEFRREILAEFVDDSTYFLSEEEIRRATKDYKMTDFLKDGEFYLGIDWGRTSHSTALVVVKKEEGRIRVVHLEEILDTSFKHQIRRIEELDRKFRFRAVGSEYAGLGMAPTEELEERGFRVLRIIPSLEKKTRIFKEFKKAFLSGKIILPPYREAPKLIHQLLNLGVKQTPSGKFIIHGLNEDLGDDLAHALVYAWYVSERGSTGFYVPEKGLEVKIKAPLFYPSPGPFVPF